MPDTATDVDRLTRRGLRLAQFTVGYNVVEGVVAVSAGVAAGLVSLIGFGIDSGIESISGVLVALRLSARLRSGRPDEARERLALRLVALTFFLLAGYVTVDGILSLMSGERPDTSVLGLVVLGASLLVMPVLAAAKRRVGLRLGDNLILADAAETRICVLLSISTFVGLALFALTGAAWLDPVAGFVIAAFAVHEGFEAWHGELADDDGD
ncbi:cation diffusion facilitator family transporter [Lysobacter korlensis]|uniref:Cation diffusion facilitator family transporter n=1 Tax=Lysobacter korlensis TaxID=553636 RepID=A0ABV6RTH5_9GAMM